ncbi:MutS-related protein [Peptoniphilus asaccharolyticus]
MNQYEGAYHILGMVVLIYAVIFLFGQYQKRSYLKSLMHITYSRFGKEETDVKLSEDVLKEIYEENPSDVDDITFKDLEFYRLYKKLNHTDSIMGSQALYNMLRNQHYTIKEQEVLRNKIVELEEKADLTKEIKFEFAKVGFFKKSLTNLLKNGIDYEKFKNLKLPTRIMRFGIVFVALAGLVDKMFAVMVLFLVLLANFYIYKELNKATAGSILDIVNLRSIFNLGIQIGKYNIDSLSEEIAEINELNSRLKRIQKKSKGIRYFKTFDESEGIRKIVDLLFLNEANKFYSIADEINKSREDLLKLYEKLGYINALTSIVSYKIAKNLNFVEFVEEDFILEAESLRHPLLGEEQVSQDFDFSNKDILITGSNASGKSTFLRNLGINVILANSLGLTHSKRLKTSFFKVESAIDISDSLEEKMSYFMAETKAIKRMIESFEIKKLLILDEIFKGTNTIDRISAAYNTLSYIAKSATVVAATHDIELTELLKEYTNYHFEEQIEDEDIRFDYKLKIGRAESRNAIAILNLMGYPREIIDGSYELASYLEDKKNI